MNKNKFREYWSKRYGCGEKNCEGCDWDFEDLWWEMSHPDFNTDVTNSGSVVSNFSV